MVVLNSSFPSKLFRFGLLKYFSASEIRFLIPDVCFDKRRVEVFSDRFCLQKLTDKNQFEVRSFGDQAMSELLNLSKTLGSKFMTRTLCGFVLANQEKCPIILNDELQQQEARKIGLTVLTNESVVDRLVAELYGQGIELDYEIIEMMK